MTYLVDLGSTKVACMAAELDGRGDLIVKAATDVPCRGLHKGVVADLESTAHAVEDALRRVKAITGESPSQICVNINGSHVEAVNAQGFVPIYPRTRHITREDVLHVINHSRQVMPLPDREQIQAIPREFRVDGVKGIGKPIGMSGGRLEVVTHILTGGTTHLQNVEKVIQMAGYRVDQFVAQPLASGLGVTSNQERELGTAIVDIGGGTTSVSIFHGGSLAYSAVLPLGGIQVTGDLSKLLKTSPEEAERLKMMSGHAHAKGNAAAGSVEVLQLGQSQARHLDRKVLCEIIESRMREIAIMVRQQIEKSGLNGMLPGGIVLTGGGSRLGGTDELFGSVIQHMQVRLGKPHVQGPYNSKANSPEFSALAGMAEFTMNSEDEEIIPATAVENFRVKIRSLKALFGTKA